jgi:ANTAR domain/GAF domain
MTSLSPLSALARAGAALADGSDAASALAVLVRACAQALDAQAVGVVVAVDLEQPDPASLELLAASSHTAAVLELYQVQVGEGPCVDAVTHGAEVAVAGDALQERWPLLGPLTAAAGLHAVHAVPLRWEGVVFGALNLFVRDQDALAHRRTEIRAFADLATVAVVHAQSRPDRGGLARAVVATLERSAVIEQAKGVVMQVRGADAGAAFDVLAGEAARRDVPVTVLADELLAEVARGTRVAWLAALDREA